MRLDKFNKFLQFIATQRTIAEIAAEFQVSTVSVRQWLNRARCVGVDVVRRGGKSDGTYQILGEIPTFVEVELVAGYEASLNETPEINDAAESHDFVGLDPALD